MGLFVGVAAAQDAPALESQKEKQSYALGMTVGTNLQKQSVEVDLDLYIQGLQAAFSGSQTLLTDEEARVAVNDLQNELKQKQNALRSEIPMKNKKDGEAFLAENKDTEGVVTLESGLQYKMLEAGYGPKPTLADTVVAHYRGTLLDGTEFDSSYKRGQPASFPVNKVIKGWSEALQLMPIGSKWQLFIPSNLAYGARGAGRGSTIGPNSTLVFEVELLSIKDTTGESTQASASALADIQLSYKLDPQLTRGLYMGERWVSPPTYVGTIGQDIVEVRAQGLDAKGMKLAISPRWIPSDPEMITVTPSEGNEVKIAVHRPGESKLQVTSQGISKELAIKAEHKSEAIQVEIAQKQ
ncbi:MAG: FKBP-type peptidyl-prolyl cis-trans isomerase [Acidobacteria bacterium]|nr:FKBP-type peptidyl-prolyl cis-trans isomerase [Acidobacteriota bacterium]